MTLLFSINLATHNDIISLCDLFYDLFEHQNQGAPALFRRPARNEISESTGLRDFITDIIEANDQVIYVAKNNGTVVGFVHLRISRVDDSLTVPFRRARCEGWIQHIAVASEYRQSGAGRALVEIAQKWAYQQEATSVGLQVWGFNRSARLFFEKLGFGVRTLQLSVELQDQLADKL